MLRRYLPPISYSALEICPTVATRTRSIITSKVLPPENAV